MVVEMNLFVVESMRIGMNLRGFGGNVILEKRLGFEGDEVLHRVLEFFGFLICFWWREKE
jgi:hypothetical protein